MDGPSNVTDDDLDTYGSPVDTEHEESALLADVQPEKPQAGDSVLYTANPIAADIDNEDGRVLFHPSLDNETEDDLETDDNKALISPQDDEAMVTLDTRKHTSSVAGASFNFINSIIGAGIIGIPSALMQSGFTVGILLLIVMAIITDYTVILLIHNGLLANKFTYQDMVTAAFGRPGYILLTLAQLLFPFFAMTGYIVIVGDSFGRILARIFEVTGGELPGVFADPRDILVKVVAVGLVMTPISLLRNISRLEKLSAFAILCIVFIVFVSVYEIFQLYCPVRCFDPECCDTPLTSWFINKDLTQTIGIMAGAFVCHHNTYLIYGSLKIRSYSQFTKVSHISVFISFLFCFILGLAGFLTFLNSTQGDLLNNYCGHDDLANAARFFYSCVVILTYPIECFVAREVLEISLSNLSQRPLSRLIAQPTLRKALDRVSGAVRKKSLSRHIVLTIALILSTLAIAVTTNDLGVVLAFNGCLTAIPLAFILPTASYLKLSTKRWCSREKVVALLVMVLGGVVMIIGTIQAIIGVVESYSDQAAFVPHYCIQATESPVDTCCTLYNTTEDFTLNFSPCDCQQFCSNVTIREHLSDKFCS